MLIGWFYQVFMLCSRCFLPVAVENIIIVNRYVGLSFASCRCGCELWFGYDGLGSALEPLGLQFEYKYVNGTVMPFFRFGRGWIVK